MREPIQQSNLDSVSFLMGWITLIIGLLMVIGSNGAGESKVGVPFLWVGASVLIPIYWQERARRK